MSLVGNLEDLSLGDILQIISLSQKSGVLALESAQGSGRILFGDGLIQSACVKGRATDLQSLLVGGGIIDPAGFEACQSRATDTERGLEEALFQETDLTEERLQSLMQESVESAVFEMFCWESGDFSFDVRPGNQPEDPKLVLAAGANAQYLAMEGMRLLDERRHASNRAADAGAEAADADGDTTASAELNAGSGADGVDAMDSSEAAFQSLFGDEPLETDELGMVAASSDPLGTLEIDREVDRDSLDSPGAASAAPDAKESTAPHLVAARAVEREAPEGIELSPTELEAIKKTPVVVIEPEVFGLDWLKAAIGPCFARVHVFQKADQGLSRIRQYMIRGEFPVVLISTAVEIDPLSGIHGLGDFVKRLKTQAARIRVIGIQESADEDSATEDAGIPALDSVLERPSRRQIREWGTGENTEARAAFATTLQKALAYPGEGLSPTAKKGSQAEAKSEAMRLREIAEKLQAASSRGEILPAVLAFAGESFARAAILVARDEEIFAVAGHGIEVLEVDPLGASQSVSVPAHAEGWIRSVVESGKPIQAAPGTDADRCLLACFGGLVPDAVYLGPILSGGGVVALLYGDTGEAGGPLPDAGSLEVVLHHAGVALDRAALERARWEADESSR